MKSTTLKILIKRYKPVPISERELRHNDAPMMDEEGAVLGPASHLDGENLDVVDTAAEARNMALGRMLGRLPRGMLLLGMSCRCRVVSEATSQASTHKEHQC